MESDNQQKLFEISSSNSGSYLMNSSCVSPCSSQIVFGVNLESNTLIAGFSSYVQINDLVSQKLLSKAIIGRI